MNIALLLAGIVSPEFRMENPKQFVNVMTHPLVSVYK